jgi:hypothetical protein
MKIWKFGSKYCLSTSEFGKFECKYCSRFNYIKKTNVGIVVKGNFPMCVKNIICKYYN